MRHLGSLQSVQQVHDNLVRGGLESHLPEFQIGVALDHEERTRLVLRPVEDTGEADGFLDVTPATDRTNLLPRFQ